MKPIEPGCRAVWSSSHTTLREPFTVLRKVAKGERVGICLWAMDHGWFVRFDDGTFKRFPETHLKRINDKESLSQDQVDRLMGELEQEIWFL